jgi:hypothetical protein
MDQNHLALKAEDHLAAVQWEAYLRKITVILGHAAMICEVDWRY